MSSSLALSTAPRIVLVRPKMSANIGSSARAMKNFAMSSLYLVNPLRQLNDDAYALAAHAKDVVAEAVFCHNLADALQDIPIALATTARSRRGEKAVYTAREAATRYAGQKVALLFGAEDAGLSAAELDTCQAIITIPTSDYASLNLAQAVQLVCYEFFLAQHENTEQLEALPAETREERATRDQLERFYAELYQTLLEIDYTDAQRGKAVMRMMRRIFDKATTTPRELAALRGLMRQINWARRQPPAAD